MQRNWIVLRSRGRHKKFCHNPEVMGSNPCWVELAWCSKASERYEMFCYDPEVVGSKSILVNLGRIVPSILRLEPKIRFDFFHFHKVMLFNASISSVKYC